MASTLRCLSSSLTLCTSHSTPQPLSSQWGFSSSYSWRAAQSRGLGLTSLEHRYCSALVKQKDSRVFYNQATSEASNQGDEGSGSPAGLANLEQFIELNVGSWSGTFTQYDVMGNALQCIPTRLSATSYRKGENISLLQTLHIKEAVSMTRAEDDDDDEPVWQEFKLGDTNFFTMEQRQQIGFFPGENAYTVSHQTSEMLEQVLRIGVLGEDDDGEEFPKGVKLPSRRPALVCESCLYSKDAQKRVRAFHVLDPRGLLDVIGIFHESRDGSSFAESQRNLLDEAGSRIESLLGKWSGKFVTRRTGIYGSTLAQCNVQVSYERNEEAKMKLEITTDRGQGTRIAMNGASLGNIMRFEGGLLTTMLPGGLALTCPGSVGQSVGRMQAFYFEFSWIEFPGQRRRLVRTYDTDGLVVSTSLATESKLP